MRGFLSGPVGLGLVWNIALVVQLSACAHQDAFQSGVLRKDHMVVQITEPPNGWRQVRIDGADVAFRDDAKEASVLVNLRCGNRDDDAPLSVLTGHLLIGTTERETLEERVIGFDDREALHTILNAKLDGVPMEYDIYVMKKDGCLLDLVYVAAPDRFARGAAEFERFASSVRASETPAAFIAQSPSKAGTP